MKFCVICWEEVHADGCGFYCKNDNNLLTRKKVSGIQDYSWLGPDLVFDTTTVNFVKSYDEPGVPNEIR